MVMDTHTVKHEQLLSRKSVADRWNVSIETVKRREHQGLLTPVKFNSRLIRLRLSDVEAFELAHLSK